MESNQAVWQMDLRPVADKILDTFKISVTGGDIFDSVAFHYGKIQDVIGEQATILHDGLGAAQYQFRQWPYFNRKFRDAVDSGMAFGKLFDNLGMRFEMRDGLERRNLVKFYNFGDHQTVPDLGNNHRRRESLNIRLFTTLKKASHIFIEAKEVINKRYWNQ